MRVPRMLGLFIGDMKRSYETAICEIEHGSFTPLIFSAIGRMADEATVLYKHLASQLTFVP